MNDLVVIMMKGIASEMRSKYDLNVCMHPCNVGSTIGHLAIKDKKKAKNIMIIKIYKYVDYVINSSKNHQISVKFTDTDTYECRIQRGLRKGNEIKSAKLLINSPSYVRFAIADPTCIDTVESWIDRAMRNSGIFDVDPC